MKNNKMSLSFCKGDALVIALVIILALGTGILFGMRTNAQKADAVTIYKDGEKIYTLSLQNNDEILVTNYYRNRISIKEGKAAIIESDCPGEDCVHSGWISEGGRSIVCLPNRVEVRIEGESEVDFIVH